MHHEGTNKKNKEINSSSVKHTNLLRVKHSLIREGDKTVDHNISEFTFTFTIVRVKVESRYVRACGV